MSKEVTLRGKELAAVRRMVRERHNEIKGWVQLCEQPPVRQHGLNRAQNAMDCASYAMKALWP